MARVLTALALLPMGLACTEKTSPPTLRWACVVRHAEAYANLSPPPEGMSREALDRLTADGEASARRLNGQLPGRLRSVWASPTGRTQATARLLAPGVEVRVEPDLRSLEGNMTYADRAKAAVRGEDPRPPDGESLADGAKRADSVLARLRGALGPGESGVLVTHGDLGPLLLGALRGTPLLDRPARDRLATGEMACERLDPMPSSSER